MSKYTKLAKGRTISLNCILCFVSVFPSHVCRSKLEWIGFALFGAYSFWVHQRVVCILNGFTRSIIWISNVIKHGLHITFFLSYLFSCFYVPKENGGGWKYEWIGNDVRRYVFCRCIWKIMFFGNFVMCELWADSEMMNFEWTLRSYESSYCILNKIIIIIIWFYDEWQQVTVSGWYSGRKSIFCLIV